MMRLINIANRFIEKYGFLMGLIVILLAILGGIVFSVWLIPWDKSKSYEYLHVGFVGLTVIVLSGAGWNALLQIKEQSKIRRQQIWLGLVEQLNDIFKDIKYFDECCDFCHIKKVESEGKETPLKNSLLQGLVDCINAFSSKEEKTEPPSEIGKNCVRLSSEKIKNFCSIKIRMHCYLDLLIEMAKIETIGKEENHNRLLKEDPYYERIFQWYENTRQHLFKKITKIIGEECPHHSIVEDYHCESGYFQRVIDKFIEDTRK